MFEVDSSERQEPGLWLGVFDGLRCWQHDGICHQKSLK